jgi:hypothetical protein
MEKDESMNQLSLVETPIARNTDPHTSHMAAKEHSKNKRGQRRMQVLDLLMRNPGSTSGELGQEMYIAHPGLGGRICFETPHKRLPDLASLGWAAKSGTRECRDSGRECFTWFITEAGRKQL